MKKIIKVCLILALLVSAASVVYAQTLQIDKKNPLIEEIVGKVSLEKMIEMHDMICSFETRHTFSDTVSDTRGTGAARRWMYNTFKEFSRESNGRLKVYTDNFDHELTGRLERAKEKFGVDKWRMVNVVAVLPGRTDDLRFIVNGHYDTRTNSGLDEVNTNPGANDDATGVIASMELARVLSGYEFEHTLVFVAFDAEEHGLLGAHHMAETAVNENWEIGGVIGDDMIGNVLGGNGIRDDSAIRVFSQGPEDSKNRHLGRYMSFVGKPYVPGLNIKQIFRLDRFGRGGDHSAFVRRGFAGVRFTELNEHFSHQHGLNNDTIEFMSREYMYRVTKMQAAILASLGMAPKPVVMQRPFRDRADYTSVIRWQHDTEENDIAGYKIFIRDTDKGFWQEIVDVGNVDKKTISTRGGEIEVYESKLPFRSVDDYIFGVAAYDRDGNVSLVSTYEQPQRNR